MKIFIVEGKIKNPRKMTNDILSEHKAYTAINITEGKVLFSSLKTESGSSVTILKEKGLETVKAFYENEPFFKNGIIEYNISELDVHYNNPLASNWFE